MPEAWALLISSPWIWWSGAMTDHVCPLAGRANGASGLRSRRPGGAAVGGGT